MTFLNQEIVPLHYVFCTMSSEDEDIPAAVSLIHFLITNQSSNTSKNQVCPFWKKILISIEYTPFLELLNDPDQFKSFIEWKNLPLKTIEFSRTQNSKTRHSF